MEQEKKELEEMKKKQEVKKKANEQMNTFFDMNKKL